MREDNAVIDGEVEALKSLHGKAVVDEWGVLRRLPELQRQAVVTEDPSFRTARSRMDRAPGLIDFRSSLLACRTPLDRLKFGGATNTPYNYSYNARQESFIA